MKKKCFLTYEEQISFLIKQKKLKITNEELAEKILFTTGYFPLINGYKEVFKNPENGCFFEGTEFEEIYELYRFDHDLRSLFLKYILIVERNIKSSLSYHFCQIYGDGQEDYLYQGNYNTTGRLKKSVEHMLKIIQGQLRHDSDYIYIRHYMNKYNYVPFWVLMNILTIGQLSKIYECQKGRIQVQICRDFGPLKVNEMGKLLAVMTKFRNVCAHNDRLFDFRTKDAVCDMNIHKELLLSKRNGRYEYGKNDLFAQIITLKLLLAEKEFQAFFQELKLCFKKYPVHKKVLERMGFPPKWEQIENLKS